MMKRLTIFLSLILSLFLALPLFAAPKTRIAYTDPAGDVTAADEGEQPTDIVGLELSSDGQFIVIGVTLADVAKPKTLFQGLLAGLVFDVDNNRKSGGQGFGGMHGDVPGIDFESEVMASWEDGAVSKTASASVIGVDAKGNQSSIVAASDAPATPVKGKLYIGRIAYASLGVKSGQTIRVIARELNDRGPEEGMFPEAQLTLQ